MPLCSKLFDCKCEVVESECPRRFVVTGDVTAVGRSNELFVFIEIPAFHEPFPGAFNAEWKLDERALSKLVEVRSEFVGAVIVVGTADNAGNFVVNFVAPKFAAPNAGNATGELIPKSSAWTLETTALENVTQLATPHNNKTKLRFITLAPNMKNRRLTYRWLALVGSLTECVTRSATT